MKFFWLLSVSCLCCGHLVSAKTVGSRVDNNIAIAGFDNYIWENGNYPSPAYPRGGGINNEYNGRIDHILNSDFINNFSNAYGGALENYGYIGTMDNLQFIRNSTNNKGGALANTIGNSKIDILSNTLFKSNVAKSDGGAIFNGGTMNADNVQFIENKAAQGGAIYNANIITIKNSSFINNIATTGVGGAITNASGGNLTLVADSQAIVFEGNKDINGYNDYYAELGTINKFQAVDGSISFGGSITGIDGWDLKLSGNQGGIISFDNKIENANIDISDVTININASGLVNNAMVINSGVLNINQVGLNNAHFKSFTMNSGTINMSGVGVDLDDKKMGRLTSDGVFDLNNGEVNVGSLTILKDTERTSTDVIFADSSWADAVSYTSQTILAPIYEYTSKYDASNGMFNFARSEKINPAIQATGVSTLSNSILVEEIYSRILSDIDEFSIKNSKIDVPVAAQGWVKYFNSSDDVSLKKFRTVDTQFDGILLGMDSKPIELKNDINLIASFYGAHVTGEEKYDSVKITQSGEYLGFSLIAYGDNFFAGITANVGNIRNVSKTMYGKDKYDTFVTGAAFKTGVNMPVLTSTIIQPNFYSSYSYIRADNYTTSANVYLDSSAIDIMQIAPGLRVIQKMKRNTDVYIDARYVVTYDHDGDVIANNILLPDIGFKSFIEYGVGVQKNWQKELLYNMDTILKISRRDGGKTGWNGLLEVQIPF